MRRVHPTVRVILFLILAAFLASGDPGAAAAAALLLAAAYGTLRPTAPGRLLMILARLRFLWLSLAVLYFWFTPGAALWPALGSASPTAEGLALGLLRIATLVLMTAAAHLLVQTATRAELIVAVEGLLRPFAALGLDRERFALRLLLVLETVPRLAESRGEAPAPARRSVAGLVARLEQQLLDSLQRAEREPPARITIPAQRAPSPAQWLWPAALGAILGGAGVLV